MSTETLAPTRPSRCILDKVPRIHFFEGDRCPEDVPFPSCMRACLEFLGDGLGCKYAPARHEHWNVDCGYAFMMGVSGAAFHLSWGEGWRGDNVALHYMSNDPAAPYRRAFLAAGYTPEILCPADKDWNEGHVLARIVESISRQNRPVLAFGVIGPPEPCIIAGYDEDGAVLMGWSFFQEFPEFNSGVEREPCGYFRKRDWFNETQGLMLFGERNPLPDNNTILRDALEWAFRIIHTPKVDAYGHERWNGLAAYDVWADMICRDEEFPANNIAALRGCYNVHDDAVGTIAEGRWYGSLFMRQAAQIAPHLAEELTAAADCFKAEHDLMWKAWGEVGGNGRTDSHVTRFASPEVRRRIAAIIRESQVQDATAAGHIHRALAKME